MKDRNAPYRRVWECAACNGLNAWNWEDAERGEGLIGLPFKVSYGSCFDNRCGHCGANTVLADSPIMAECYTHQAQPTC
jgi:hypothetical protein